MVEQLQFGSGNMAYSAMDAAEHLARYACLRAFCKGRRVLDVGCGDGFGSYLLAQWGAESVTGIDVSSEAIGKARTVFHAANVTFLEGDACRLGEALPAKTQFDLVCAFGIIECLADPNSFLASVTAVRAHDCVIAISAVNATILPEGRANSSELQRFDFETFAALTEAALGEPSHWMLGAPLVGFLVAPEPSFPRLAEEDMRGALCKTEHGALDLIPPQQDAIPSTSNAHFWVGFWGGAAPGATVAAPQSMTSWMNQRDLEIALTEKRSALEDKRLEIRSLEAKLAEERRLGLIARAQADELRARGTMLSHETVRTLAVEVWRERRRRGLPYKVWREASRVWRRVRGKRHG